VVGHPSAIEVTSSDGSITLRGPILDAEATHAVRCVGRIRGVRNVIDHLERHRTADIPSLQGGTRKIRSEQWPPSKQVAALAAGASLAVWGLLRRRGLTGTAAAIAGSALALRGTLNLPLARILGYVTGRESIRVRKTIDVHAPIEQVFQLWNQFENFARFMQHVRSIERDPRDPMRARWHVDGFGGLPLTFDTMITRIETLREIAWQTPPDQPIRHAGVVRFEPTKDGTRVHIDLTYRPPGGVVTHAIAHLLGWDPKARIDDDMMRMKTLLEYGRARAHGDLVTSGDILH